MTTTLPKRAGRQRAFREYDDGRKDPTRGLERPGGRLEHAGVSRRMDGGAPLPWRSQLKPCQSPALSFQCARRVTVPEPIPFEARHTLRPHGSL